VLLVLRSLLTRFSPFLLLPALAGPAFAQTGTATLSGSVVDESNAVIPDVTLTLVNADTAVERRGSANGQGAFAFPFVLPGRYTLSAHRDGFAPSQMTDITLAVGDHVSITIALKLGTISDVVSVVGSDRPLRNESAAVSTSIDRRFVEGLPVNGRSFQSLILLAPGAVPVPATYSRFGQFSINGQRESANYFTIDGVSANIGVAADGASPFGGGGQYPGFNAVGGTTSLVSTDALEEFTIQTSTVAPEFGRSPGGQISIVTRSGTNRLTGSAFEFFRDEALDANDWFARRQQLPKAELRNHQFGAVLGGPIMRDRTFFFASYEGLRLRLPQTALRSVPTIAARQSAQGAIREILNGFPLPTGEDLGDGTAEFSGTYSEPSRLDAASFRVDHRFGAGWSLFGRYNGATTESETRGRLNSSSSSVTAVWVDTHTVTAGATGVINASLVNDLRVNVSGVNGGSRTAIDDFGGAVPPAESTLFPAFAPDGDAMFRAYFNSFSLALVAGRIGETTSRQFNIVDTLSMLRGRHQLKFGLDSRWLSPRVDYQSYQQVISFNSVADAGRGVGSFGFVGAHGDPLNPRFHNLSLFAQDAWSAHPRLTLTFGARWELNPAPREADGNDIRTVVGLENPATMALAPEGARLWNPSYDNVAPRVGAAYELRGGGRFSTQLRGGFGVFYDITSGSVGAAYDSFAYPHAAARSAIGPVPFPFTPAFSAPPQLTTDPPYNFVYGFDPRLELPRTRQWNVSVDQGLGERQWLTASYVGAAGRRLYRVAFYGSPNPNFDNFHSITNDDSSDYKALQLQFRRRLSSGFQAVASYTLSRSTDTASFDVNDFSGNLPKEISAVDLDRGPSDFDIRHTFSAAASYDIPAGTGPGFVAALRSGWSVDAIGRAYSAPPVTVITDNQGFGYDLRADAVPGQPFYLDDPSAPGGRRLNPAAFVVPDSDRHGSLGRNALRGFAAWQIDLGVRRRFRLSDRFALQARIEVFNLFNRANFAKPIADPNNPFFGQSVQMLNRGLGGLNAVYQIGGPRSTQLGLRLEF
jgi:hypothetical protein